MESPRTAELVQTKTLYAVIGAIAEGPNLDRVLRAIVELLADATSCHACFVYLREGDLLRIRAALPVFAHAVGRVVLGMDEGLTGWVARNRRPAFIREAALDDPRMKYVPELHEERFQSMVAVPLIDRQGDVIGVVVLHTQAPREFSQDVLDLLVHVASLVVGAVDNARLYEQTRRQLQALSELNVLSQELASLRSRETLYTAGCEGIGRLLAADECRMALYDEHGVATEVARSPPADLRRPDETPLGPALVHAAARGRLRTDLLDGGRAFGTILLTRAEPFDDDDVRLLETAANQLALALRTAEILEGLAAESLVPQVFRALEEGAPEVAAARARAAGWDLGDTHVAVAAWLSYDSNLTQRDLLATRLERRLHAISAGALIDVSDGRLRALMPLPTPGLEELRERLSAIATELKVAFGISRQRVALTDDLAILSEAETAAKIARALSPEGGTQSYDDLGAYRFLAGLAEAPPPDPVHAEALLALACYDDERRAALVDTLEAFLEQRGSVRATAEALVIHVNTLRQRLDRVEELTQLSLNDEDLLSLELSLKLHRLRHRR